MGSHIWFLTFIFSDAQRLHGVRQTSVPTQIAFMQFFQVSNDAKPGKQICIKSFPLQNYTFPPQKDGHLMRS